MRFWKKRKTNEGPSASEWGVLVRSLLRRLLLPFCQPAYVFFFVVSMIIGATGIWVSIAEAWISTQGQTPPGSIWADPSVFKSILTFFAGLGSLSCIQVIVVEDKQKNLRALLSLLLITFIILAVVAALLENRGSGEGYPFLATGTALAIVTWWLANWDDEKYSQNSSLDPLGGDTETAPAGDTEGYAL
ncbi:hypothetical protein [Rhizobium sp. L1K21]|uniref:hypothetical protein n=1 Tax=Rhizobium sp. L1K21 TaxID=2954933 RepID=UPI002092209E|nr:hypothetical protein [Rhizobium sp. L1K21]MCO6185218.1 hypothetical protein [Rhizobium sp. L1K21]